MESFAVKLKKQAFYETIEIILKPTELKATNSQGIQESTFYFSLTQHQATEIVKNRDISNPLKISFGKELQLRLCLIDAKCEQDDCFPSNVHIKVNGISCLLPNAIPLFRANTEPKRPSRPINITSAVKLNPSVENNLTVQWSKDMHRTYAISLNLVRKVSPMELLQTMKTKGVKPADYTRALIKEKLTEDADCEIATTMLKVSLMCPLGKMRMSLPCRSSTCSHLQCFDANLYLQMNEKKPTWNCPVCDKPATYENLVIDGYFQEVLGSPKLKSNDTEIQLHKDGSWSTHIQSHEAFLVETPIKNCALKFKLSDNCAKKLTAMETKITSISANKPSNTNTNNTSTVDLTVSDSEDDLPLKCLQSKSKSSASTGNTVTVVHKSFRELHQIHSALAARLGVKIPVLLIPKLRPIEAKKKLNLSEGRNKS